MFSSATNGDCLYSSVSLVLFGGNLMVEVLRILTCIELFLHADFYCSHPLFFSCFSEHRNNFPSLGSLLAISVSDTALLTNCKSDELVRQEAIHSCCKNRWSSFLSILALSTVVGRSITTFYPDIGFHKYKLLFNQVQGRIQEFKNLRQKFTDEVGKFWLLHKRS